ncbi:TIGR00270 family protein [Candidatus Woesearchaeota archaeon]|nr:TIGR00270 family protein [Candidatus Woesearchaeota archaeon]
MAVCELCGKEAPLISAIVEGSQMDVCMPCGKFGKVVRKPTQAAHARKASIPIKEIIETVTADYAAKVRQAREKSGMTQADFAKALNEKESVIQKLETGTFHPPISMARKLEKMLKITLVHIEEEEKVESEKKASSPLTIGDLINLK